MAFSLIFLEGQGLPADVTWAVQMCLRLLEKFLNICGLCEPPAGWPVYCRPYSPPRPIVCVDDASSHCITINSELGKLEPCSEPKYPANQHWARETGAPLRAKMPTESTVSRGN